MKILPLIAGIAVLTLTAGCRSRSASDPLFPAPLNSHWGFIDRTGHKAIPGNFENVRPFSEGLAAVKLHGRWGYIDFKGQQFIPALHRGAQEFRGGLAIVDSGLPEQPFGLINSSGAWVVAPSFRSLAQGDDAGHVYIGMKATESNVAFYDSQGKRVFGPYEMAFPFSEGRARVKLGSDGSIDTQGRFTAFPDAFPESTRFSGGLIAARKGGKVGYMEPGGLFIIPPRYDKGGDFREGLAPVEQDGLWLLIDPTGAIVAHLPETIQFAEAFSEGRSLVTSNRKLGYVDRTGKWVIRPRWDDAEAFHNGLARVGEWRTHTLSYINPSGKVVWEGTSLNE